MIYRLGNKRELLIFFLPVIIGILLIYEMYNYMVWNIMGKAYVSVIILLMFLFIILNRYDLIKKAKKYEEL